MTHLPSISTLFPYTTLFRSGLRRGGGGKSHRGVYPVGRKSAAGAHHHAGRGGERETARGGYGALAEIGIQPCGARRSEERRVGKEWRWGGRRRDEKEQHYRC